jgi:hypothetical protein
VRAWEAEHGEIVTHGVDHGSWSTIRNLERVRSRAFEDETTF